LQVIENSSTFVTFSTLAGQRPFFRGQFVTPRSGASALLGVSRARACPPTSPGRPRPPGRAPAQRGRPYLTPLGPVRSCRAPVPGEGRGRTYPGRRRGGPSTERVFHRQSPRFCSPQLV